ncbi:hypothetical protein [Pontibacter sp. SGAir0037]|uniref:hypothetical protein n=1 Tax=Pontibacter sp. SGAir0037 TaxID=2571030 RepID=UPI0010CD304B|nr:hypothetical protein [Pontibacter sp. SGAir0037]QCR23288.1 hypothetical protein C1N53_13705 [Pontibacter sp. SGAir0037]
MKIYKIYGLIGVLFGAISCTSLSEGEGTLPPDPDLNRRVVYSNRSNQQLRRQMYEQSSDINRKRNIEEFNGNGPATTPNTLRPRLLPEAPPVDENRHNVQVPMQHRVPVD